MIDCGQLLSLLASHRTDFVCGVPDSTLKSFVSSLGSAEIQLEHVICSSEGAAVGLAIGRYLSTGCVPLVYMQNSGLGNAINPLASLASSAVYAIPMILLIGWRGELDEAGNSTDDEPQHQFMGRVTPKLLNDLDIPFVEIQSWRQNSLASIDNLIRYAMLESRPVALLVGKNALVEPALPRVDMPFVSSTIKPALPKREDVLAAIVKLAPEGSSLFATTGYTGRELVEIQEQLGCNNVAFLAVGGMGHISAISAGFASANTGVVTICIDGDGSLLMHTGNLAHSSKSKNMLHVVINNGIHESVGGAPTSCPRADLTSIAKGFGFENCEQVDSLPEFKRALKSFLDKPTQPTFIEVLCAEGVRPNLKRPERNFVARKKKFMEMGQ